MRLYAASPRPRRRSLVATPADYTRSVRGTARDACPAHPL